MPQESSTPYGTTLNRFRSSVYERWFVKETLGANSRTHRAFTFLDEAENKLHVASVVLPTMYPAIDYNLEITPRSIECALSSETGIVRFAGCVYSTKGDLQLVDINAVPSVEREVVQHGQMTDEDLESLSRMKEYNIIFSFDEETGRLDHAEEYESIRRWRRLKRDTEGFYNYYGTRYRLIVSVPTVRVEGYRQSGELKEVYKLSTIIPAPKIIQIARDLTSPQWQQLQDLVPFSIELK